MPRAFESVTSRDAQLRQEEHGGVGAILFRRVLQDSDFNAPIDFVDYTVVPPGSTIGAHTHVKTEEIYFVAAGSPLMRVNGEEKRMHPGGVAIVHDGGRHELINDTQHDVEILVIQVRVCQTTPAF